MLVPKLRFKREDGSEYPEWKSMPLGERFTFKNGINASREAFRTEGVHCIGVSDVYKCLPITAENVIGTVAISDDEIEKNKVNYGDILFQRSSETKEDIGHASVYYDDAPSVYNGFVICGKPDKLFYDPLYLHYSLQNTRVRKQTITLGAGSGQHYNIGQEGLAQINAVFPCLEEQQRISDLVFFVDKVILQTEAEVQNLEQQKKAAMQKIFSQEVRFKREDGTEYPEWEEKTLQDVSQYITTTGTGIKSVYVGTENMQKGCAGVCFDCDDDIAVKGIQYVPDDILISNIRPYLKKAWKADRNGICSTDVLCIRGTSEILSDFLYTVLSSDSFFEYVMQGVKGTKMPRGDKKHIMEMPVFIPCFEEQQKIADFLSAYDEAISYAKQELEHWKQLKKGLLQQMFV